MGVRIGPSGAGPGTKGRGGSKDARLGPKKSLCVHRMTWSHSDAASLLRRRADWELRSAGAQVHVCVGELVCVRVLCVCRVHVLNVGSTRPLPGLGACVNKILDPPARTNKPVVPK